MNFPLLNAILQNLWIMFFAVGFALLLIAEIGYRCGRRHHPDQRKSRQSQSSTLQGALLGMVGLLLGFTFAMAVGRYDARKQLVLDEANAIGTVWLRAGFLSDPSRDRVRETLADYIDIRLQGAASPLDSDAFREAQIRSEQNQGIMWRSIVAEFREKNTPSNSLFAAALNDLIDLDSKRLAAFRNHVPQSVWILLLLVSGTVCFVTGYSTALGDSGRHKLSMLVLPLLIAAVLGIIADLDNPQQGLIRVSQQSMLDLQQTLKKYQ